MNRKMSFPKEIRRNQTIELKPFANMCIFAIMFQFRLFERCSENFDRCLIAAQFLIFLFCALMLTAKKAVLTKFELSVILFLIWSFLVVLIKTPNDMIGYLRGTAFGIISSIVVGLYIFDGDCQKTVRYIAKFYAVSVWVNAVLMLLFPTGIIVSDEGAPIMRANWLYGSKNTVVFEISPILMFLLLDECFRMEEGETVFGRNLTLLALFLSVASMGSRRATWMAGSTTAIIMILFFYICAFMGQSKIIFKLQSILSIRKITILSIILTVFIYLLSQGNFPFLNAIISLTGKTYSFSGRNYVWKETMQWICRNPIMGIGNKKLTFYIHSHKILSSVYSFWMNILVRYGLIGFILCAGMFCFGVNNKIDYSDKNIFFVRLAFLTAMIGGLMNVLTWKNVIIILIIYEVYTSKNENIPEGE